MEVPQNVHKILSCNARHRFVILLVADISDGDQQQRLSNTDNREYHSVVCIYCQPVAGDI
jgi:hypothetical protein